MASSSVWLNQILLVENTYLELSFHYAIKPAHGNWFQTNQPEHESDDCASLPCVCYQKERHGISPAKFDQHMSLYCGSVKPKLQTGPGYRF